MIQVHWTILFCCTGGGFIFGFVVAAILASAGQTSRCEECKDV